MLALEDHYHRRKTQPIVIIDADGFELSNTDRNTFSYSTFSKKCQSSSILHENLMFLKIL
jgi:hypothetical protein